MKRREFWVVHALNYLTVQESLREAQYVVNALPLDGAQIIHVKEVVESNCETDSQALKEFVDGYSDTAKQCMSIGFRGGIMWERNR